jgi:hypothetical protein
MGDSFPHDGCGRRMDLMDACQRRAGDDRIRREAPVGFNGFSIIAAAQSAVQAGHRSSRQSADAAEKSVGNVLKRACADD